MSKQFSNLIKTDNCNRVHANPLNYCIHEHVFEFRIYNLFLPLKFNIYNFPLLFSSSL